MDTGTILRVYFKEDKTAYHQQVLTNDGKRNIKELVKDVERRYKFTYGYEVI